LFATFVFENIDIRCNDDVCFHDADERETDVTDVADTDPSQVAAAGTGSPADEDVTGREALLLVSLGEMIYHFLAHAIDIMCSNLIDKLVAKKILLSDERQKIKEPEQTKSKVKNMLTILSKKSAAQFESFLTTLSETGQQSVADVVRVALRTVRQTEHSPLQYSHGMTA